LVEKLKNKTASIGVVGLGYVGLPLAMAYTEEGYKTIGFEIDQRKVDRLNAGETYIEHILKEDIQKALDGGFRASSDMKLVSEMDALILCVPTPLSKQREPDMAYIRSTIHALLPHLREGQIVSLESTTYPGTTDEEIKPQIEARGFTIGENFFLVF